MLLNLLTFPCTVISELQAKLNAKQNEMANMNGDQNTEEADRQRAEYARRGISLVAYEAENVLPYFINLEDDAFR